MLAGCTTDQVEVLPVTRGNQKSSIKISTGMTCFLAGQGSVAYVKETVNYSSAIDSSNWMLRNVNSM
jgi:hypothetical protein